jgi:hypothetical protein
VVPLHLKHLCNFQRNPCVGDEKSVRVSGADEERAPCFEGKRGRCVFARRLYGVHAKVRYKRRKNYV